MIYALNLFNLMEGKEDSYREYNYRAGRIIYKIGGRVICSGHSPLRFMAGDVQRKYFIIVEFPGREAFDDFHAQAGEIDLHRMREESTKDYIWTLFEPWDLREWVKDKRDSDHGK